MIYDNTPAVKKKILEKQVDTEAGYLQDRYVVLEKTLSKDGWTGVTGSTDETYSNYSQDIDVSLNDKDFVMVDADDDNEDLMSDSNIYAETVTSDNKVTALRFYADEVPESDIAIQVIVFAYTDSSYTAEEDSLDARITALETALSPSKE